MNLADGTIDIEQVKRLNERKGKTDWFGQANTRFFKSRYPTYATVKNNKAYFVTSEQFDYESPRLYTIRVCDMETGYIDTVGEFQQYQTSAQAKSAIKSLMK